MVFKMSGPRAFKCLRKNGRPLRGVACLCEQLLAVDGIKKPPLYMQSPCV